MLSLNISAEDSSEIYGLSRSCIEKKIVFLIDVILGLFKNIKFLNLNFVRVLIIMYACSAIYLGQEIIFSCLGPMLRSVFRFIVISVDDENIENDSKTIVWTENILSAFGAKTPFSNVSGLVWTGPYTTYNTMQCNAMHVLQLHL